MFYLFYFSFAFYLMLPSFLIKPEGTSPSEVFKIVLNLYEDCEVWKGFNNMFLSLLYQDYYL